MVKEVQDNNQKMVDRRVAADLLGVSIRTIDRYLKSGKLSKKEIADRIFIPLKEVNKFTVFRPGDLRYTNQNHTESSEAERVEEFSEKDHATNRTDSDFSILNKIDQDSTEQPVYQKLFEELQEEIKNKQERLEGANYRVGQLEALLKESVPLLDHKKALSEQQKQRAELEEIVGDFEKTNLQLSQSLQLKQTEIKQISSRLHEERRIKTVFMVFLLILFLLQPLWLLLPPL